MASRTPDDVPRLPRGKGIRLSFPQLMRIAMVATVLVAVIVMQKPCADAVSKFVVGIDEQRATQTQTPETPAAVPQAPNGPDPYAGQYLEIKPGMTEAELKALVDKARQPQ